MSILSEITGESKEFEIGGKKLTLKPLSVREMLQVMRISKEKGTIDGTELMIKLTLKKSVPDATDKEIEDFEGNLTLLSEFISDLNHLPKPTAEEIERFQKSQ